MSSKFFLVFLLLRATERYIYLSVAIESPMKSLPRLSKKHQEQIAACLDILDTRIYSQREIEEILATKWDLWHLPLSIRIPDFLDHLIENSELKKVVLRSPNYDKE